LNIAVNSPERLSGAVNVTILGNDVLNELNSIIIGIQAWSDVEHNEDGSHKDITADSLTATGNVVAGGDGEFGGDVTVGESLTVAGGTSLQATSIGRAIYIAGVDDEIIGADDVLYNAGSLADVGVVRISSHANQVCGIKVGTSATTDYRAFWLFNDSATAVTLEHESAVPASASYRLWLPLAAPLVLHQYEGAWVWRDTANSRWRVIGGSSNWISVAHADANFTGNATGNADWVVDAADQITLMYRLDRNSLKVAFTIAGSDVANAPTELRIAIPGGFTAAARFDTVCSFLDAGVPELGVCYVAASGTTINFQKIDGSAFTNTAADNTNVTGQIEFAIS
jgi:hypothetical protein